MAHCNAPPPIPEDLCVKVAECAAKTCQPIIQVPPQPANSTADSLAALSTAFTFGSILLAIIALLGGLAWGLLVKVWAEREAKAEAQKVAKSCAEEYIAQWMAEEAPAIIRRQVDLLNDATIGEGDDAKAADDIGKEAG